MPPPRNLATTRRMLMQEMDILSDNNAFLEPFTVAKITKEIMRRSNIEVAPELVMLPRPYNSPGTFQVPLAVLDDVGAQVTVTLQLIPRQATAEQLRAAGIDASAKPGPELE